MAEDYFAANRLNWDDRAALHASDSGRIYRIDHVLAGGTSLHEIELSELGDIAGRDVAHLQCHIGLDTISLAHLGARATGLDFSPAAIAAAGDFAARAGVEVPFVEASVYDAVDALGAAYDVVFVTWGAINWLPDLPRWAAVVARLLKPAGFLYLAESHPAMNVLEQRDGRFVVACDWRTPAERPLVWDEEHTYTGDPRTLRHTRNYEWIHPISEVVGALIAAGLRLDFLHEHERIPWPAFPDMVPAGEGLFALPSDSVRLPLAYSLKATKP